MSVPFTKLRGPLPYRAPENITTPLVIKNGGGDLRKCNLHFWGEGWTLENVSYIFLGLQILWFWGGSPYDRHFEIILQLTVFMYIYIYMGQSLGHPPPQATGGRGRVLYVVPYLKKIICDMFWANQGGNLLEALKSKF